MLIVLRGNSGSGKSTTAKLIREMAIKHKSSYSIALVEQDYLRRIVLKEKETASAHNIDLIYQTCTFALKRSYVVVLEGILYSQRYKAMLLKLCELEPNNYFYYFDIPLEETIKRHNTKSNANEFGETELREWYKDKDLLNLPNERIIDQSKIQVQIVAMILADTNLIQSSSNAKA